MLEQKQNNVKFNWVEPIGEFLKKWSSIGKNFFMWLIISYLIPVINILLLVPKYEKNKEFKFSDMFREREVLSIILVTNACYLIGVFLILYEKRKENKGNITFLITNFSICLFLFIISILENNSKFLEKTVYIGTYMTLILCLIQAIYMQKEEFEDEFQKFAKQSRSETEVNVADQKVKI